MMYAALLLIVAALARATDATDECASSLAIEDVERYKRDGYVIIRNLFSAAEADVLRRAIERRTRSSRQMTCRWSTVLERGRS